MATGTKHFVLFMLGALLAVSSAWAQERRLETVTWDVVGNVLVVSFTEGRMDGQTYAPTKAEPQQVIDLAKALMTVGGASEKFTEEEATHVTQFLWEHLAKYVYVSDEWFRKKGKKRGPVARGGTKRARRG